MVSAESHEPQSIVHQIIRTSRIVTRKVKECSSKRKGSNAGLCSSSPAGTPPLPTTSILPAVPADVISVKNESWNTGDLLDEAIKVSMLGCNHKSLPHRRTSCDTTLTTLQTTDHEDGSDEFEEDLSTSHAHENDSLEHEVGLPLDTINQNDFMIQCMIDTSRPCLVHFYVEESVVSEILDRELGRLHAQSVQNGGRCRFMRLNANAAPFITSKLQVSNQDPSIICIHNGQVFERIANVESLVLSPGEVQKWAARSGLMGL
jgi:hypothetical protein